MAEGYNPNKAAVFNQLRQQGLSEDAAIAQAGIADADLENYAIGTNGQLGAFISGFPASGRAVTPGDINQVNYDENAFAPVSSKTPTTYTTTSTTEVSGGGSITTIAGEDQPTAASLALQPAIDAKQAEIEQFNRDNPSNFARRKLGLPLLTPEENQKRNEQALALSQQKVELASQQASAMLPGTPTVIVEPNTTITTVSISDGTTSVNTSIQSPDGADPVINQQTESTLGVATGPATAGPAEITNDPYAGLTPKQLQDLGGADPTDPYIRARLGIPQLPGSTLTATPGFGTINTGIPILDTAISSIGSLFGFNNTKTGTTTGSPAPTPNTAVIAQSAAEVKSQNPNLTEDEKINLTNIDTAQVEIDKAQDNIQANNRSILANEEAQAEAQEQQRQAQAIIDQNNAELADPFISDERRAVLEENNAAQRASIAENAAIIDETQTNIDNATANNERQQESIQENQTVVEENAAAFTANGNELGAPVDPFDDPELAQPTDDTFVETDVTVTELSEEETAALFDGVEDPTGDTFVESDTTLTILSEEETNALFDGIEDPLIDTFVEADVTVTELTEEETAALFDGAEDPLIDTFVEADVTVTELTEEETAALFDGADTGTDTELTVTELAEPVNPDADPEFAGIDEQVAANENSLQEPNQLSPEEVDEYLATVNDEENPENFEPTAVDEFTNIDEQVALEAAIQEPPVLSPAEVDEAIANASIDVDAEIAAAAAEGAEQFEPTDVNSSDDEGLPQDDGTTPGIQNQINDQDAADEAAARDRAKNQATLQARYKQPASSDWRVRLQLAPNADYLYKDRTGSTILAPLYETDGVIFPYTPQIETTYNANYEMYDLTHSNFRGYFYKNSRVNDINIRATFTAQDTQEANYLLAVIHFFRSVTKMFYGSTDALRGAPPPLTYLSGLGQYQFNQHPCVVSQFNYSLPNDVDYIRAGAPNNYGTNLLTQRARTGAIAPEAGDPSGTRRNAAGLTLGGLPQTPSPSMINQNVNNQAQATYVPTKIEISLTLLPINTRSQVSKQFNMKDFASGALIKGGFW